MNKLTLVLTSLVICAISNVSLASNFLLTTDTTQCHPDTAPVTTILGGTSLDVLQTSKPEWQSAGFNVGTLVANEDVFTCILGKQPDTVVDTPEKRSLDQAASSAVVAINASIVQTSNLFTRLATLRAGQGFGFDFFDSNFSKGKKKKGNEPIRGRESYDTGGGASADESGGLLDNRLSGFINGNITIGDYDKSKHSQGFDFDTKGITLGADYRISDQFFVGSAFGYTASNTEINHGAGQVESDSYSLSIYSTYSTMNNFYIDLLGRVGWNEYIGDRDFSASADNSHQHAKSSYSGNDYSISFGTGYNLNINGLNINPLARFDYMHNIINGYSEDGRSVHAADYLSVEQQKIDSMRSAVGLELNYTFNTSYAILSPSMRAEWQHEFMNDSRLLTSYHTESPLLETNLRTESPDRDFVNLGFGLSAAMPYGISGFLMYETMLANHSTTSHSFNGGIRMEF